MRSSGLGFLATITSYHGVEKTEDYEKALRIYLEKGQHSSDSAHIFELIKAHALWDAIQNRILALMQLDKDRAADLLSRHVDRVPVNSVIEQLKGYPELQHCCLHNLFEKCPDEYNRELYAEFHDLQAHLYADYSPEKMLKFLQVSNYVNLEKALAICESHKPPLYDAMIFILSRMGKGQDALDLLVTNVGDVHKAIEFVQEHEDNLWDNLIQKSLQKASFLSELLDYAGSHGVDPNKLVTNIPEGMQIHNLRGKLLRILVDYNQQVTLRRASSRVFASDCSANLSHLLLEKNKALRVESEEVCCICRKKIVGVKLKKTVEIALFFCGHHYHRRCLASTLEEIKVHYSKRRRSSSITLVSKGRKADFGGDNDFVCTLCHYSQYVPRDQAERAESSGLNPDEVLFVTAP